MAIPIIDERIKHIGPASLRKMNGLTLLGLRDLVVIQDGDEPLAVLIPYEMYLEMQREVSEGKQASSLSIFAPGFQADGPVNVLPKISPEDYGTVPDGIPWEANMLTDTDVAYHKDAFIDPANERRKVPRSGSTVDMTCDHCGKPGAALCPECFMAGHRAVANCRQCAENGAQR